MIGSHPREFVGILMATVADLCDFRQRAVPAEGTASGADLRGAAAWLHREEAPAHPAAHRASQPNAAIEHRYGAGAHRARLIANIQRELTPQGFYDGAADGIWGAKTDARSRDFLQAAGVEDQSGSERQSAARDHRVEGEGRQARRRPRRPSRNDPIAELIAPSKRVLAIQRALSDFGYGQIKPTGAYDPETSTAIEKFERDRRLPVRARYPTASCANSPP